MDPLQVPLAAAALLLVPSGAAKVVRPGATLRAVRTVGLPASAPAVRALGAAEVVVGAGVVVGGSRWWSLALALLYAAFSAFVVLALWRRAPLTSCGCFGDRGTEPTPLHVGLDAGVAAVALLAAADDVDAPLTVLRDGGGEAVVLVVSSVVLAVAMYVALTHDLVPTRRGPRQGSRLVAE